VFCNALLCGVSHLVYCGHVPHQAQAGVRRGFLQLFSGILEILVKNMHLWILNDWLTINNITNNIIFSIFE
jgi:hypothetical protein